MTTVAWKTIEHNWPVYADGGEQVGNVFLVVGDENEDIFDGLAITHGSNHSMKVNLRAGQDQKHVAGMITWVAKFEPNYCRLAILVFKGFE